jgi:hypothetical protein
MFRNFEKLKNENDEQSHYDGPQSLSITAGVALMANKLSTPNWFSGAYG